MKKRILKNILLSISPVVVATAIPVCLTSCSNITTDFTLEEGKSAEFTLEKAKDGSYISTSSLELKLNEKYKFAKEEAGTFELKFEYDNLKTTGNVTLAKLKMNNPTWVYNAEGDASTLTSKIKVIVGEIEIGSTISFDLIVTLQKIVSEKETKTYCGPSRINGIKLTY